MKIYFTILLAIFIIITIVYWSTDTQSHPKILGYINMLSVLSTIAIILGLVITIQNNERNEKNQLETQIAMLKHQAVSQ